ncbi:Cytochrome c biogenesis ATP-binding export protein CcmA [Pseudorhizobium banfieldiae]|uniref:Cytochrome c biogenesis ATP-binding export protein CcmA n=1 Tax=Pseudorhizobium banfieldiae TaxID=1125847 RepID=L0NK45_9HYPH|nr:heme ABC exporter ATP-binding protein CcmA [Pseudorhizobium banfieldiae]CAD6619531.1 heme ABC exporter ATP-binding protein CcmA [arsenite-oxidising bacterium NT-25]CCF21264.1 Cytochrome c biogenesis ATP-binding export protein CcmA [Pseudorhizobium banfieldiae]
MRLTAEKLAARRGEDLLFSDISFELGAGEGLILIGRNGSGKSTLLRVVAGLLRPEFGQVRWSSSSTDDAIRASEACHYLGHRNAMKAELSVQENLAFWKEFCGDFGGGEGVSVAEAAEQVGLGGIAHLPFGYLSAGQQRRMAFAKLLVSYRPVWILDEPTAALDTRAEATFADLIRQHLARGGILLAATHQPLGIEGMQELRMTGFAGVAEEFAA